MVNKSDVPELVILSPTGIKLFVDSLTHIVLGAVVGEAVAGKTIGKRAMVIGALAQSLPDIDVLATLWLSPTENLLAHRGFTHSFLFVSIASVILAFICDRVFRVADFPIKSWILFLGSQILIHQLIDACNAYGTGWFEPFSDHRISINLLFVADPFFSAPLGISALVLFVMNTKNSRRMVWVKGGLFISILYLGYAFYNKQTMESGVQRVLNEKGIKYKRYLTTPTPLNTLLWFVAIETDSGFYTTHRSVFDHSAKAEMHYFPQQKHLLRQVEDSGMVDNLVKFSEGYYTLENRKDTLLFNDLRFGQITGWATPDAKFVFHFYLQHPEENAMVIQRGRFANWNKETFDSLLENIKGK